MGGAWQSFWERGEEAEGVIGLEVRKVGSAGLPVGSSVLLGIG